MPNSREHLARAEQIWEQREKMGNLPTPKAQQTTLDALYHAVMALNANIDPVENVPHTPASVYQSQKAQDWYAAARQRQGEWDQRWLDAPKPEARFDLVQIADEDFSLGLSKLAPVGVKIMVMVDDKQYFIHKGVDHIQVSEGWA